jgi:uncharacterized repeat protein (TIGR03803 family)
MRTRDPIFGNLVRAALALASVIVLAQTVWAQTFALLTTFNNTNGENPVASLLQGTDGNFYGTTEVGGANDDGTIFKITHAGAHTAWAAKIMARSTKSPQPPR